MFRAFVKHVLDDDSMDKQIEKLKKYMVDNGLEERPALDYVDFFDYNPYMAMKQKNRQKLNAGKLEKIELESSQESSTEEADHDEAGGLGFAALPPRARARYTETEEIFGTVSPGL